MKGATNMNDRKKYEYVLKQYNYLSLDLDDEYNYAPTQEEQGLYRLSDDRVWTSDVDDIDDGDNFADYCKDFFKMLDEEEYYDN